MTALLSATGLRRCYRLPRPTPWAPVREASALGGVSLQVAEGERVGLVGASGSGKSTLVRTLLALEAPDAGLVTFRDRPVRPASTRALRWFRREVQYVPQDPASSLDPRMRVAESIAEPLRRLGVPGDHRQIVADALHRVGLEPQLAGRRPGELSGGQAQRVAIARALASGPALLLADEPVSGMDPLLREQVVDLLSGLCRQGLALLLVSHDLSVVQRLCTRTVVLADGLVVEDRPTADLLTRPHHPRTRQLVDAVPVLPT